MFKMFKEIMEVIESIRQEIIKPDQLDMEKSKQKSQGEKQSFVKLGLDTIEIAKEKINELDDRFEEISHNAVWRGQRDGSVKRNLGDKEDRMRNYNLAINLGILEEEIREN